MTHSRIVMIISSKVTLAKKGHLFILFTPTSSSDPKPTTEHPEVMSSQQSAPKWSHSKDMNLFQNQFLLVFNFSFAAFQILDFGVIIPRWLLAFRCHILSPSKWLIVTRRMECLSNPWDLFYISRFEIPANLPPCSWQTKCCLIVIMWKGSWVRWVYMQIFISKRYYSAVVKSQNIWMIHSLLLGPQDPILTHPDN